MTESESIEQLKREAQERDAGLMAGRLAGTKRLMLEISDDEITAAPIPLKAVVAMRTPSSARECLSCGYGKIEQEHHYAKMSIRVALSCTNKGERLHSVGMVKIRCPDGTCALIAGDGTTAPLYKSEIAIEPIDAWSDVAMMSSIAQTEYKRSWAEENPPPDQPTTTDAEVW